MYKVKTFSAPRPSVNRVNKLNSVRPSQRNLKLQEREKTRMQTRSFAEAKKGNNVKQGEITVRQKEPVTRMLDPLDTFFTRGMLGPSLLGRRGWPSLFSDEFEDLFGTTIGKAETDFNWVPKTDIVATDNSYVITAELPGVSKDAIKVEIDGDTLTIKGERKEEKEDKEGTYYRKEMNYGSFLRSFTLPEGTDPSSVKAYFENGILKLTVPKTEESKSAISIPIETGQRTEASQQSEQQTAQQ
jgi:HSP20 family protein